MFSLKVKCVQQRRILGITEGFLEEMVFELSTDGRKKVRRMITCKASSVSFVLWDPHDAIGLHLMVGN